MKIGKFGKKISKDFNRTFAKKNLNKALEIGKKIGHQIDVGERKLVNTIHDVAPSLAIASDFYMPGSGEADYVEKFFKIKCNIFDNSTIKRMCKRHV